MSNSKKAWMVGLLALAAVIAAPAACALERGEFQDGLYTAPGAIFTVRSPLGPNPWVIDSFDSSAGAVTFLDETGGLYGIICTPSFDPLAGANNDTETDLAILRNWLHEATFPLFFERQLPGAAIMREEPGTFEGKPAWLAVMHLPRGSALFKNDPQTGLPVRQDSYRGLIVFSRGDHTFLIMKETEPDSPWNSFMPALSDFYHGMAFALPPAPQPDPQVADVRP
jgi:hypothetical protein